MEGIVFVESSQLEQCVEGITIVEGAHLLACSQPHEFIAVTFVAPSGWSHCSSVPRDITASGLHSIAQGLFPDRTICLRRAASPILVSTAPNSIIVPDSAQPFLNETSQIVAISLTWLPRCVVAEPCPDREQIHCEELVRCEKNWVYAIRAKKWDSARAVLLSHARPDLLVRQRDGGGETPLAWAAYGAGSCRAAADLVHLILKAAPGEAAVVCPGTGFTPLHDAAWGNAAAEVAALLCLFYPEALFARGRSGETPHTVVGGSEMGWAVRCTSGSPGPAPRSCWRRPPASCGGGARRRWAPPPARQRGSSAASPRSAVGSTATTETTARCLGPRPRQQPRRSRALRRCDERRAAGRPPASRRRRAARTPTARPVRRSPPTCCTSARRGRRAAGGSRVPERSGTAAAASRSRRSSRWAARAARSG
ncbi:unnamed protein product [Prorocentrum cordatum]|uniref:Uncharacterized protein n=1 Tax=Prorocentrum cordatum TaxID=2364126 RepID=A0ABN9WK02_9DINO|nr:unnamed protein product [Polarella glacialis]